MIKPTPPIELMGAGSRFGEPEPLTPAVLGALREICAVRTDLHEVAEASRDWWPLAMHWALAGEVARRAAVVVTPHTTDEVAAVMRVCHRAGIAVTAAGGRSNVVGATVPLRGGVVLDLTGLSGVVDVDETSGVVAVRAGTFGPDLEDHLRDRHGLTVGHRPQSFDISTVGGWLATRGAGQYSTRYGKIEHLVHGLEVVLADGTIVRTGGHPAAADGPDLTQMFVGSEGTLGIITTAWLRARPVPQYERRHAYRLVGSNAFDAGLDTCRRILRRGATPAVLRLYDETETARLESSDDPSCLLLVLDEGDPLLVDATLTIVEEECASAVDLGPAPVDRWVEHRNDTSALQALTRRGFVVDTLEVSGSWSTLGRITTATTAALRSVAHCRVASCHLSHSYLDGACLYFTFVAMPPQDEIESTYIALWDAGQRAALGAGAAVSHHHGLGLSRARFAAEHHGAAHAVHGAIKVALDPTGMLNPGKMGLPNLSAPPSSAERPSGEETTWPPM